MAWTVSILATTRQSAPPTRHELAKLPQVGGVANERQRDVVEPVLQGPGEILAVLVSERGHLKRAVGQIDALARANRAAHLANASEPVVEELGNAEADHAVFDENAMADLDLAHEFRAIGRDAFRVADDVASGDSDLVALADVEGVILDGIDADLGSAQITHHGGHRVALSAGRAHVVVCPGVLFECAVGKVESKDVHARVDEAADHVDRVGGGPECCDDFGLNHSIRIPVSPVYWWRRRKMQRA